MNHKPKLTRMFFSYSPKKFCEIGSRNLRHESEEATFLRIVKIPAVLVSESIHFL